MPFGDICSSLSGTQVFEKIDLGAICCITSGRKILILTWENVFLILQHEIVLSFPSID